MKKAWQLIQALEEGKVLSKGKKEFILFENRRELKHYLKKTASPLEDVVLYPERWEIISVQKFERLFANF